MEFATFIITVPDREKCIILMNKLMKAAEEELSQLKSSSDGYSFLGSFSDELGFTLSRVVDDLLLLSASMNSMDCLNEASRQNFEDNYKKMLEERMIMEANERASKLN